MFLLAEVSGESPSQHSLEVARITVHLIWSAFHGLLLGQELDWSTSDWRFIHSA